MTTYTLIAYKPQHTYYYRREYQVAPSILLKEEEVTKVYIIAKVIKLLTEQSEIDDTDKLDCLFTDFYIFPTLELKDYEAEEEIISMKGDIMESTIKIKKEQKEQEKIKEKELKERIKLAEKEKRKVEFEQLKIKLEQMKKEFE